MRRYLLSPGERGSPVPLRVTLEHPGEVGGAPVRRRVDTRELGGEVAHRPVGNFGERGEIPVGNATKYSLRSITTPEVEFCSALHGLAVADVCLFTTKPRVFLLELYVAQPQLRAVALFGYFPTNLDLGCEMTARLARLPKEDHHVGVLLYRAGLA